MQILSSCISRASSGRRYSCAISGDYRPMSTHSVHQVCARSRLASTRTSGDVRIVCMNWPFKQRIGGNPTIDDISPPFSAVFSSVSHGSPINLSCCRLLMQIYNITRMLGRYLQMCFSCPWLLGLMICHLFLNRSRNQFTSFYLTESDQGTRTKLPTIPLFSSNARCIVLRNNPFSG